MQAKETNSRPQRSDNVALRTLALRTRTSLSSLRVFSFDLSGPITGNVTVRRSSSTLMAPVLNRTRPWSLFLDLNRGNPTFFPLRTPDLDAFQFLRAVHRSAMPLE
jgi:hypothetical protein